MKWQIKIKAKQEKKIKKKVLLGQNWVLTAAPLYLDFIR